MKIQKTAKLGDIILCYTEGELTNIMIDGPWKHAALVGEDSVIESIDPVVRVKNLQSWLASKTAVALIRPRQLMFDGTLAFAAVETALKQVGAPYDYQFHIPRRQEPNSRSLAWQTSHLARSSVPA